MLEMAVSLVGVVMFTYVVLKTWVWLTTMIPQRQASFQQTRVLAGKQTGPEDRPKTAGMPVPYQPPQLALVGGAGATTGTPGRVPAPDPVDPPCVPGNPNTRAAQALDARAEAKMGQYNDEIAQVDAMNQQLIAWGHEMQSLQDEETQLRSQIDDLNVQIDDLEAQINDPNTDPGLLPLLIAQRDDLIVQRDALDAQLQENLAQQAALQAQIDALVAQRDQLLAQANQTLQQATDLYNQAHELLSRGFAGCP